MVCVALLMHGLKVIFPTENNMLNIIFVNRHVRDYLVEYHRGLSLDPYSSWSLLMISQMYLRNCFSADNSNIFLSGKNLDILISDMNSEIVRITD